MTEELPKGLKFGERVRFFSVVSEGGRERRALSALLASLSAIPSLSEELLATLGVRTGSRTQIDAYTEVVLADDKLKTKDRPDALIRVRTGRQTWSALVEAKIGNAVLAEDQVRRYAELARDNSIDAILTISNQFVTQPSHHPVKLSKILTNKVQTLHWSWTFIQTYAYLLDIEDRIADKTQALLLNEFVRFLNHSSTGVARFESMNKEWRDVVRIVQTGGVLSKNSESVQNTIGSWHQETRDLCLLMSRRVGRPVRLKLSRAHRENTIERVRDDCQKLCEEKVLACTIEIPDAASDISISADLQRRTISCTADLRAPEDKTRTSARVNWLVRQLSKTTSQDVIIKAKWPGRAPDTQEYLSNLRNDANSINPLNSKNAPRSFEVIMVQDVAGRFAGSRMFIEALESIVPTFYEQVGQYLKRWLPAAPKPIAVADLEHVDPTSGPNASVSSIGQAAEEDREQ